MATGVRQDTRQLERAIDSIEKRIILLEKSPGLRISKLTKKAGSSYDADVVNAIIDKINEIIGKLG